MWIRLLALTLVAAPSLASAQSFDWKVRKDWTPALEQKFGEFVKTMGESGCRTFKSCVTSKSGNPFYVNKTPTGFHYAADCADLPFALRAYFAWMEGLPFDYVNTPVPANPNDPSSHDIRYTKGGNKPGKWTRLEKGNTYNFAKQYDNMRNSVSTATYRMSYDYVNDFYPLAIDQKTIKAGAVVYDPAGHAAIVYKVDTKRGIIHLMDAHPDNSITRIVYSKVFSRSRKGHGAGLKAFRPELSTRPSSELPGFSEEQWNKNFSIGGQALEYYDYVKAKMAGGDLRIDPVAEQATLMEIACSNVKDRMRAVNDGIATGIHKKDHPYRLPGNIYGTDGEWEEYSTPSRDARLKTGFVEIRQEMERYIQMYREGSKRITYKPTQSKYSSKCGDDKVCYLAASLMETYEEVAESEACQFHYNTTDGDRVNMNYHDIIDRLYKMSFDPYHCVELRWGASGNELNSCRDGSEKLAWYKAEQRLRNQIDRKYDDNHARDVNGTYDLGVDEGPDADVFSFLSQFVKKGGGIY